jgi:putative nucleotidyltransferase with HDIG domain
MMTRDEAIVLLRSHVKSDNLVNHALAVEAAMRAYAGKFGQDEHKWGLTGLLHDIDYEEFPTMQDHPWRGAEWLARAGLPEDVVYAVKAHGNSLGLARADQLSKALYAVDELTGFIVAVALVRPSKKIADVEVKSVTKKMKDKSFAAAVNRDEMDKSARELGVEFTEHVATVLEAMKAIAAQIAL